MPSSTRGRQTTRRSTKLTSAPSSKATKSKSSKRKAKDSSDEGSEEDEEYVKEYDSDALDEDSEPDYDEDEEEETLKRRRKRAPAKKSVSRSPRKKRRAAADDDDSEEFELKEGQEVVGVVVQAPKTGHVPPGQISKNTLNFLSQLAKPEYNDREWFKLNEPVYRLAEKEWVAFVECFTDALAGVDTQIPHLPPKDVIHRIYRDMRFSNDKTPYKKHFSAGFSRSGRKGIFAGYFIAIEPGNKSLIAAGSWCPGKNELATIRNNIQRNPRRLRSTISHPDFVKFFGKPEPHPDGERRSIFGMEDELKVAPKGVGKGHKDIDLLKCRSFAVVHRFMDSEVLSPDFKDDLLEVARVMMPFVHCLNDMMTIVDHGDEDDEEDEGGEDSGEDE